MQKLSRRKIAEYMAQSAIDGVIPDSVIREVAAYLVESQRVRELPLVVRTAEEVLAERGVTVARITSTRPLSEDLKKQISVQIGSEQVYIEELIDASVLGGVKIQTPRQSLDATVLRKINSIRSAKAS